MNCHRRRAYCLLLLLHLLGCAQAGREKGVAGKNELTTQTLLLGRSRLSLAALGPLVKQDYEVSRDESAFVLKSEFYTHRSDAMEQVVAWVQGRDGLEPALEDRLKGILGETAREQGLKTIEYSASPRLVSGLQGIEARANYQSKGQSITMRSILFRKAAEAWHVTLYFVRGNQEAERLANEIFDSVKIELVEPQKHVQE